MGSAKNLGGRWSEHRSKLSKGKHPNRHLQSSWRKHGEQTFKFSTLIICRPVDLIMYEQIAIDALNPEYNIARVAGNTLGCMKSEVTRERIAEKARGRVMPPRSAEYRAKVSARFRGHMPSPEHMAALQAARKARVYTDADRKAIGDGLRKAYANGSRCRTKSEQHKNKISKAFSKLNLEQVREIKRLRADGVMLKVIAAQFKIGETTVSEIARGITYRWADTA